MLLARTKYWPRFSNSFPANSFSREEPSQRDLRLSHDRNNNAPAPITTATPVKIFCSEMRQDMQNSVAPNITRAKAGMPALETANTMPTLASTMQATDRTRRYRGKLELSAATK